MTLGVVRLVFVLISISFTFNQEVHGGVIPESDTGIAQNEVQVPVVIAYDIEQDVVDGVYADDVTSRRPELIDILGGGLQSIFQGIVRAPGQIAKRVQVILNGIIRPATSVPATPPKPATPAKTT